MFLSLKKSRWTRHAGIFMLVVVFAIGIATDTFAVFKQNTNSSPVQETLFVEGAAFDGSVTLKNLNVKSLLTVGDDLFQVRNRTQSVIVGVPVYNDLAKMKVGSSEPETAALAVEKPEHISGSAILARNSHERFAAIYARNDQGAAIMATTDARKGGAVTGKVSQASLDISHPAAYSSGIRGEAQFRTDDRGAMAGVLGVAYPLSVDGDGEARTYGLVGVGAEITNPLEGDPLSPRVSAGVYGSAGDVRANQNEATVTYGVLGEAGLVYGEKGSSWAGYFRGNVGVTGELAVEQNAVVSGSLTLLPNESRKQIILDRDGNVYLNYNEEKQCVELWMPLSGVNPEVVQMWGKCGIAFSGQ